MTKVPYNIVTVTAIVGAIVMASVSGGSTEVAQIVRALYFVAAAALWAGLWVDDDEAE